MPDTPVDFVDVKIVDRVVYVNDQPMVPVKPTAAQYAEWNAKKVLTDNGVVNPVVLAEVFAEIDAPPTAEEREIRAQAFQHYRRVMTLPFQSDEDRCKMDGNGMAVGGSSKVTTPPPINY